MIICYRLRLLGRLIAEWEIESEDLALTINHGDLDEAPELPLHCGERMLWGEVDEPEHDDADA